MTDTVVRLTAETCNSCRFWPTRGEPIDGRYWGIGGPHTDGSVSDCRRHAPRQVKDRASSYPHDSAIWPETKSYDWCGDYEARK